MLSYVMDCIDSGNFWNKKIIGEFYVFRIYEKWLL